MKSKLQPSTFFWLFLLWASITACDKTNPSSSSFHSLTSFESDCETVSNGKIATNVNGIHLGGSALPSSEFSHSGTSSLKIDPDNRYAAVLDLNDIHYNNSFTIRAWRYSTDGEVILMIAGDRYQEAIPTGREENGWEEVELTYRLNTELKGLNMRMQATMRNKENTGYLDDIRFIVNNQDRLLEAPIAANDQPNISLSIKEDALNKLSQKRDAALAVGILQSTDDDWIDLTLDGSIAAKARLKGDWTDHLEGEKWSMRIELPKGQFWKRMRKFSIQSPATRKMLSEWILHRWYEREDILTTRYDFSHVSINGKAKGIYSVEEHFTKQLLETQQRREGPILKWNEDHLWKLRVEKREDEGLFNTWSSSEITLFSAKKYKRSPTLYPLMESGRNLLWSAQHNLLPADEVYDIKRMATYMAIQDLMMAYHGNVWHNMRFYYNPLTSKLEPIAFDGDSKLGMEEEVGVETWTRINKQGKMHGWQLNLYKNASFIEAYLDAVARMSDSKYLNDFFSELAPEMKEKLALLHKQYPDYVFDLAWIEARAAEIKKQIGPNPSSDYENYLTAENIPHSSMVNGYPRDGLAVRCYELKIDSLRKEIAFANYLPQAVTISRLVRNEREYLLTYPIVLPGYTGATPSVSERLTVLFNPKSFVYTVAGDTKEHCASSTPLALPEAKTPNAGLTKFSQNLPGWIKVENGIYTIPKGKYALNRPLYIPSGGKLILAAGASIGMGNGAFIYTESPVVAVGTSSNPIHIFDTDNSSKGFIAMQTNGNNTLAYVHFDGLYSFDYNGRSFTGAVTFYESDVNFNHCQFLNNKSEDGLNIIRSQFDLASCKVAHCKSDGIDADFSSGKLDKCEITETGNDGIDFSGSQVEVDNCVFKNIGDKAISVGEESILKAGLVHIEFASIGCSSKDLSTLEVKNSTLKRCDHGFAVYSKKPEYGPATLISQGNKLIDCGENLIEKESLLILDGKELPGTLDLDIAGMYARFQK